MATLGNVGAGVAYDLNHPFDADPSELLSAVNATGLGYTGAGITVGVISDSFDSLGGASQDEQSGALPPASQINVLEDDPSGGSDEGRAMMQIVHAIAPGANLDFYTADVSEQDFANGILALAAAGCKVICDDVSYLDEPFFQTGIVADAIHTVEQQGVTFVTAAGNEGEEGYQSGWDAISRTSFDGVPLINVQDFGGGSPVQTVTIGAFAGNTVFELQWKQPFGAATTDLGILVFEDGSLVGKFSNAGIAGFTRSNFGLGSSYPILAISLSPGTYQIAIEKLSGPDPGVIKDILFANGSEPFVSLGGANAGTVVGHHMSPDAITVGAVDTGNTVGNGGTLQSEYFSSSGLGTQLWYNFDGTPVATGPLALSPVAVSGVDDIATSVPGGLNDFFGTSSATPSVAGIIADMLQANPHLTPTEIKNILVVSATAFGDPNVAGSGLINALLAVADAEIVQIYQEVLGRDPLPTELGYWQQSASGSVLHITQSLSTVRVTLANSPEAASDLTAYYQGVFGQTPSASQLAIFQDQIGNGSALAGVEAAILLQAENAITGFYQQVLGRAPDPSGLASWQQLLANGNTSLAQILAGFAASPEATSNLTTYYSSVLGQVPSATQLAAFQGQLASGSTLAQVEASILTQAQNEIAGFYQQVLGRAPDAGGLASWQQLLANGTLTLAQILSDFVGSPEATGYLTAYYSSIFGEVPSGLDLATFQNQLAAGSTLAQVKASILTQAESAISGFYQQILGRAPDAGGLLSWQQSLTNGNLTLAQIRTGFATSPEATDYLTIYYSKVFGQAPSVTQLATAESQFLSGSSLAQVEASILSQAENAISGFYQQILGRAPDAAGLASWQQELADGYLTLAQILVGFATSPEVTSDLTSYYSGVLGLAPSASQLAEFQSQLTAGSTLTQVEASILTQAEDAIPGFYQDILGRAPDQAGLAGWQQLLANGGPSLAEIRTAFITSAEGQAALLATLEQVQGHYPTDADIAYGQQQLASGVTLAQIRSAFADAPEVASDLSNTYRQIYDGEPSQNVLVGLQHRLAAGTPAAGPTLQDVEASLQNPLILGTVAGQGITDQSSDQPFAVTVVSDPHPGLSETATITLTNSSGTATDANGALSGGGLTHTGAGTYTLTNATPADLTTSLEALVFTPTQGQVSLGQSVTTNLSLLVQDKSGHTGTDTTTSITAQAVSTPTNLNFMYGSIGSDTFTATAGADVIGENVNPLGNDVVSGFNLAQDIVQLSAAQFANFAMVQAALTSSNGNAVLNLDSSDSMTLLAVDKNSLQAANFKFV